MSRREIKVLTHGVDVDGVICAALIFKRFPNATVETGTYREELSGEYDIVVDLPLPKLIKTRVWIDHHSNPNQAGESEKKIYDPEARSAAGLLAGYLGMKEDKLVQIADRADSVSYLTEPPTGMVEGYDPAWDVNDAVKAISTVERFRELAKTLALEGVASVRKKFESELSYTRNLRRKAGEAVRMISNKVKEQKSDAAIIIMPPGEMDSSTVSGHIVFSLYREGVAKACAVFYEGGCWLNTRRDFNKIDASEIMARFGGGGHPKSAGSSIGPEKSEEVKRELEKAGLKPLIIDLRKVVFV
ncbi:MAG: hypothetical protein ACE5OT_05875 [Candidatus Hadarchaeaceae archaeon]